MNPITHTLLFTGLASFTFLISSCGNKGDEPSPEPVEAPVVAKIAPKVSPVSTDNALAVFATPDDELTLPTEAQTAEGKDSSIGAMKGKPISNLDVPDSSPSIAITPHAAPATDPSPKKPTKIAAKPEDELDPQ